MGRSPETAREAAALLLEAVTAQGDAARLAATNTVCEHLLVEIGRWIGAEACDTLAARALATAARSHPLLVGVQLRRGTGAVLDGLPTGADADDLLAAVGGFLVAFIELLARFVGESMAIQLALRSRERGGARER